MKMRNRMPNINLRQSDLLMEHISIILCNKLPGEVNWNLDQRFANLFEALVATLQAAKKRTIVKFDAELLFQGLNNNVDIILVKP
ncbi:unnamed protein product [Sphagnum tenellum]